MVSMKELSKYGLFDERQKLIKRVDDFVSNHHLTKSSLKILRLIEWFALKNRGACWLKVKTIAEKVGVSDSTVRRSIRQLKKLGILEAISTTRTLSGGDGANIYVIQPVDMADDRAEMTDRNDVGIVEKSSDGEANSGSEYVSSKDVTKKEKEYEKEEFDYTYVRDFVPKEFVDVVKRYFDDASKIEQLWKKVLICIGHYAPSLSGYEEEAISGAIKAFKQAIFAEKQKSIRGSFGGYFYGVLVKKFAAMQRKFIAGSKLTKLYGIVSVI